MKDRLEKESEVTKKTNFDRYLEEQLQDSAFATRFERAVEASDVAMQLEPDESNNKSPAARRTTSRRSRNRER